MPPALRCDCGAVDNIESCTVDGAADPALPLALLVILFKSTSRPLRWPLRFASLSEPLACKAVDDHLQTHRRGGVAMPIVSANFAACCSDFGLDSDLRSRHSHAVTWTRHSPAII